ncbi:MAG: hypothetical protein IPH68_03030 [Chitinophagaceae bacterium]|nr:hypothetical protein [Chitinophagaceae bacterium]MBK7121851.1 hypothetical protein [Chitinophagaceae bacterium]MBK7558296.1 hypothetical protein [Chitinophagaceae bacterium]MBK9532002.1 hypothetical protein [Chitinophagaceae bacterium]HQW85402.1 hypothetical protein [Ferruginibacter sp.]
MKKQTTPFSQISKEQTANLTAVVNETLAIGFNQARTFSTADLWNIQRRSRTMLNRRSFV